MDDFILDEEEITEHATCQTAPLIYFPLYLSVITTTTLTTVTHSTFLYLSLHLLAHFLICPLKITVLAWQASRFSSFFYQP